MAALFKLPRRTADSMGRRLALADTISRMLAECALMARIAKYPFRFTTGTEKGLACFGKRLKVRLQVALASTCRQARLNTSVGKTFRKYEGGPGIG